ncbi:hypothetical protein bcgnr5390_37210 [Bacillus luti]
MYRSFCYFLNDASKREGTYLYNGANIEIVKRGRTKLTTSFDILKELSRLLANTLKLTIQKRSVAP